MSSTQIPDASLPPAKPPVFRSVARAYSDLRAALTAMPDMLLVGLIASCAYVAVEIALGLSPTADDSLSTGVLLASTVISLVWNFFITPIFIAIHRFVVLGEITPRYRLAPSEPRFLMFFGWTVVLSLAGTVPTLLGMRPEAGGFLAALGAILMILFFIVSVRMIILFPAIAVDAPGADWPNAYADSRGNFWRIFGIILLTMLPLLMGGLLAAAILGEGSRILKVIWSLIGLFGGALGVTASSRLYQALARRLQTPVRT